MADIKKAYKTLVFEKHPDRNPAYADEFARIISEYRFICANADELGIRTYHEPQRVVPRRVVPKAQAYA